MMRRLISRTSGFTILELVIVMIIYGVLMIVAMPQIQKVRLMNTLSAGQQVVASTLLRARWLAINRGEQEFVTLSGSNVLQIRAASATGTIRNSADLSNYSVTVDDFTPFGFDARGFLPTATTVTVRQPSLAATKTVTIGLYGRVAVN